MIKKVVYLLLLCTWTAALQEDTLEVHTPENMCKLYVASKLFNFTGIDTLSVTPLPHLGQESGVKYTLLASICNPITLDQIKSNIAEDQISTLNYTGRLDGRQPNVVMVRQGKDTTTVVDIAYINSDMSKNWKAKARSTDPVAELDDTLVSSYQLDMAYDISNMPEAKELRISRLNFKNICINDDDFDFYDQRVEDKNMIFQYNGKKACELVVRTNRNLSNYAACVVIFIASLIGSFLNRGRERIALAISSIQGSFIFILVLEMTISMYYNGALFNDNHHFYFGMFKVLFVFIAVGFSYFSRYVSLFCLSIATTYAINWTILYMITILFKIRIAFFLCHLGAVIDGIVILMFMRYSPVFREKYAFMINTSISNSFYLCFSLSYLLGWMLDMFSFNSYSDFGMRNQVTIKNWFFMVLQLTIMAILIFVKVYKSNLATKEAIKKNADLFRSSVYVKSDGYGDIGDIADKYGDGPTIIAM